MSQIAYHDIVASSSGVTVSPMPRATINPRGTALFRVAFDKRVRAREVVAPLAGCGDGNADYTYRFIYNGPSAILSFNAPGWTICEGLLLTGRDPGRERHMLDYFKGVFKAADMEAVYGEAVAAIMAAPKPASLTAVWGCPDEHREVAAVVAATAGRHATAAFFDWAADWTPPDHDPVQRNRLDDLGVLP